MSSRRPRRSRVYDLNYNIAENYYKSAIDRLDEKYHSRPASILTRHSEPPATSPVRRPRFEAAVEDLEDGLEYSRERASRAIQKETILDQRASRKGVELEASFDGQVCNRHFPKTSFSSTQCGHNRNRNFFIIFFRKNGARINIWTSFLFMNLRH